MPVRRTAVTATILFFLAVWAPPVAAEDFAYRDYAAMERDLRSLAAEHPHLVSLTSLGRTLGGREVYVLSLSDGAPETKPAILIAAGLAAEHLVGSEIALGIAQSLLRDADAGGAAAEVLGRTTVYIVPRADPDGCEGFFARPLVERLGNTRPSDEDRDGRVDEDGPDDLDGDGYITWLRIEDPDGEWVIDTEDPRRLRSAGAVEGPDDRPRFRLYPEGRDDDEDEAYNEDGPGGVRINRNFPYGYKYFVPGGGIHQVSEVESRALADFAYAHPEIALVYTLGPDDNLTHPWKKDKDAPSFSGAKGDRPRRHHQALHGVMPDDEPYFQYLGRIFGEVAGIEKAPEPPAGGGDFPSWAYYHYGRWSLASRGWCVPDVPEEKKSEEESDGADKPGEPGEDGEEAKPPGDKKKLKDESAEVREIFRVLRWLDRDRPDAFVPWHAVELPGLRGRRAEVGGLVPFARWNPPAGEAPALIEKQCEFVRRVEGLLPRLEVGDAAVEALGFGLYRVEVRMRNTGYLPTASAMGQLARWPGRLSVRMDPGACTLVSGHRVATVDPITGNGGEAKVEWVLAGKAGATVTVVALQPCAGRIAVTWKLP